MSVITTILVSQAPPLNFSGLGGFTPQTLDFTISWDAIPTQNLENVVHGLSFGAPANVSSFACAILFNPAGSLQVRNGGTYMSSTPVLYSAGVTYHFRVVVRLSNDTYDVYVEPQGQPELLLANNFGFRTEQVGIATIDYLGKIILGGTGDLQVFNRLIDALWTPDNLLTPPRVILDPTNSNYSTS